MSTLKAKTIQPVSDSDTLVLRTGASDSLTLDTNGNATIRGELTVDGIPIGQGLGNKNTNTRVGAGAAAPYQYVESITATTCTVVLGYYVYTIGRVALDDNFFIEIIGT